MIHGVGLVQTKSMGFLVTPCLVKEVDFSTEAKNLYKRKLLNKVTAFTSNNLNGIFSEKQLVAGEKLISHGHLGAGAIRYLQYSCEKNEFSERKKVLDALFTIGAQHIFLKGCYKNINSNTIFLSEKHSKNIPEIHFNLSGKYLESTQKIDMDVTKWYYKNIKKGQPDKTGRIFKDMVKVMDAFGANASGGVYSAGQVLNPYQDEILRAIDPVFIYFYLTPGVEIHAYNIESLHAFFYKNKGIEVVLIGDDITDIETYLCQGELPQKLYQLDCREALFHHMDSAPIFNFEHAGHIDGEELVFCGDPKFGTIRHLKQPSVLMNMEGNLTTSLASEKKILDALLAMKAQHVFVEGFLGNISGKNLNKKEFQYIQFLQEAFKKYTVGKKLNAVQTKILSEQKVEIVYYYLAPLLLGKDIHLYATTTLEQVKKEELYFSGHSMVKQNYAVLNKKNTCALIAAREKCTVLKLGLFFREHPGEHVALIFNQESNLRLFCNTNLFGKFIPRYFELSTAKGVEPSLIA